MVSDQGPDPDEFDAFLPRLLDLDVLPPAVGQEATRGRRVRSEFGEFAGHVPYAAGEDLRFLDWNVLARSGQRVLRRFDAIEQRRLDLTLDLSASMAERAHGVSMLARVLVFLALHRLDAVELSVGGEARLRRWSFAGAEAWPSARDVLRSLSPGGSQGLPAPDDSAGRGERGGLRVVVSDFEPEAASHEALVRWAQAGVPVLCLFPRTLLEAGLLPPVMGPSRIVERESGRALEVPMSPALFRAFLLEQQGWEERLQRTCRELGHELLVATLPAGSAALRVEAWLPFLARRRAR